MNQNGARENGEMDVTETRYRGSGRRGRGRGNYDRGRGNRDRRTMWREPEPAIIDVHDNDQFPSITEAGPRRVRQQQPQEQPRAQYGHIEHNSHYRGRGRGRYSNQSRGYVYNGYRRGVRNAQSAMIPGFSFFHEAPRIVYPADFRQLPEVDIVQQVEYYFSEHNLIYDQYLRSMMDIEGFVRVAVIHCFKRVASFKLTLEQFTNRIRSSDKLEVSENGLVVRVRVDWERWVRFNDYIRQNELQDISSAELTGHYVRFMRNTFGPDVVIPEEYMMPPQSKVKTVPAPVFQPQSMPMYGEGMMSPFPFYPAFDPSIMYSMGPPSLVGYPMYSEVQMEYPHYDPSQQNSDPNNRGVGRQYNPVPVDVESGIASVTTMVENLSIQNPDAPAAEREEEEQQGSPDPEGST